MNRLSGNLMRAALLGGALALSSYVPQAFAGPIPTADVVTVGNTMWAQPNLFVNNTWNVMASACSSTTGACAGTVSGYDLTGWTWASQADVVTLFNHYLPTDAQLSIPGRAQITEPALTSTLYDPATLFSAGQFSPTGLFATVTGLFLGPVWPIPILSIHPGLVAFTRTQILTSAGAFEPDTPSWDALPPLSGDTGVRSVSVNVSALGKDFEAPIYGGFFYRPYTVPEPPELDLIGIGLVGLAAGRRNQKRCRRNV